MINQTPTQYNSLCNILADNVLLCKSTDHNFSKSGVLLFQKGFSQKNSRILGRSFLALVKLPWIEYIVQCIEHRTEPWNKRLKSYFHFCKSLTKFNQLLGSSFSSISFTFMSKIDGIAIFSRAQECW